jgi:hypothetical protein
LDFLAVLVAVPVVVLRQMEALVLAVKGMTAEVVLPQAIGALAVAAVPVLLVVTVHQVLGGMVVREHQTLIPALL